jgi:hypothetical protein
MSQCAEQVFTGVSSENFACLQGKAAGPGDPMDGGQGSAPKDGITVTWDYEPEVLFFSYRFTNTPPAHDCFAIGLGSPLSPMLGQSDSDHGLAR